MLGRRAGALARATGSANRARAWNVIAQTTAMAQFDQKPGPGRRAWTDGWDGYPAARERLLEHASSRSKSRTRW